MKYPTHTTKKELQQYLGVLNFYRRFLRGAAKTLIPLTNLLKKTNLQFIWNKECETSFQASKLLLKNCVLLKHPDPNKNIRLYTDSAVGAVLSQATSLGSVSYTHLTLPTNREV